MKNFGYAILDRVRVLVFGILVALVGLVCPDRALTWAAELLRKRDY